jgi:hypothetical protein
VLWRFLKKTREINRQNLSYILGRSDIHGPTSLSLPTHPISSVFGFAKKNPLVFLKNRLKWPTSLS